MKTTRVFWSTLTMLIVATMLLAACGAPAATEAPAAMAEVSFDVMPGGALEQAIKGEYKGTTVTVDGAFEGQ